MHGLVVTFHSGPEFWSVFSRWVVWWRSLLGSNFSRSCCYSGSFWVKCYYFWVFSPSILFISEMDVTVGKTYYW